MTQIKSIFNISGNDENALTKSFGVILKSDKTLLKYLLCLATHKNVKLSKKLFEYTEFFLEKSHKEGRTDIEIENNLFHVIIESKIGINEVRYHQANKYAKKLSQSKAKVKVFIFLTEIGNLSIDSKLKRKYPNIIFKNISWDHTLDLLEKRREIKVNLVEEYKRYILEGRKMRIYDKDIWAVVANGMQEKNFNNGIYINRSKHKPILIGRREWDKKRKQSVVMELRPVLEVLDEKTAKKMGPKYDIKRLGGAKGDYVYRLGGKMKLLNPILPKSGKFSQASAIHINLDCIKDNI